MIDAALDVLHDGSGWLLIAASVAVVAAIRHLRHLSRLRAAAALHDPQGAPLDPYGTRVAEEDVQRWSSRPYQKTWSNVATPPGGQRYLAYHFEPDRSADLAAEIGRRIEAGELRARFFPHSRPYDWSDDDDLA